VRIGILFSRAISFIFRNYLCLILYNVKMFVLFVLLHLLLSYIILCSVKIWFEIFLNYILPQIFIWRWANVINEQGTFRFELGNQSRTDATSYRMLTTAVHCTYRYVQLRRWFPFCRKVAEFMNSQLTSSWQTVQCTEEYVHF